MNTPNNTNGIFRSVLFVGLVFIVCGVLASQLYQSWKKINELEAQNNTLTVENTRLVDENLGLRTDFDNLMIEFDRLNDSASLAAQNIDQLNTQVRDLQAVNATLNDQYSRLSAQNQDLNRQVTVLTSANQGLATEISDLQKSYQDLSLANQDLAIANKTLQEENSNLKPQVEALSQENQNLKDQIEAPRYADSQIVEYNVQPASVYVETETGKTQDCVLGYPAIPWLTKQPLWTSLSIALMLVIAGVGTYKIRSHSKVIRVKMSREQLKAYIEYQRKLK